MPIGFETDDENKRIDELEKLVDDIIDTDLTGKGGNDLSLINFSKGARNSADGDSAGVRSSQPITHNITDVDEGGTPTGIFDKINLISSMIIVDHTTSPMELKFIQGTAKDGATLKITVRKDKVLILKTGGSILTSDDITITDTQIIELVKHSESETGVTGGAYKIFISGGGSTEFFGPWTAPHDAGIQTLNDLRAVEIVDINGVTTGLISGVDGFGTDITLPSGDKLRFVENITDLVEISAAGIIMATGKDINLNKSKLKSTGSIEFDDTVVFNPTTKNVIGFDSGIESLIYNTAATNKSHVFKAGGELLASITRVGINQGQILTFRIVGNVINATERMFLSTNTIPGTPADGNFWRNASGLFQFQQNGVTLGLGGGNVISQGDSSVLVSDTGFGVVNFITDGIGRGNISGLGWNIDNSDLLISSASGKLVFANGFEIQNTNSLTMTFAIPNNDVLRFTDGGIDVGKYDSVNKNWIFNPSNDVQLSPTLDVDLTPQRNIVMNPTNEINVFKDINMQGVNTIDFSTNVSAPVGTASGGVQVKVNGVDKIMPVFDP